MTLDQNTPDQNTPGQGQGVRIVSVIPTGPAARAGLKPGDRIVKVDGQTVSSAHDVVQRISQMNPQQSAELTVITNGATEELDIQLASRAETLHSLPANRIGYDNQQGFGVTSPPAFNTQTSGVGNNESLAQILNGIRQELQQIRQQLRQLETGSNIRDNNRVG